MSVLTIPNKHNNSYLKPTEETDNIVWSWVHRDCQGRVGLQLRRQPLDGHPEGALVGEFFAQVPCPYAHEVLLEDSLQDHISGLMQNCQNYISMYFLFSNRGEKVLKSRKTMGQICPIVFFLFRTWIWMARTYQTRPD